MSAISLVSHHINKETFTTSEEYCLITKFIQPVVVILFFNILYIMVAELSLIRWWLDNLATDSSLHFVCMYVCEERVTSREMYQQ